MAYMCGCTMNFETISCKEFCSYLMRKKFSKDVVQLFRAHRICGNAFLSMHDIDFTDLVPRVGDRIMLRNLQCHVKFNVFIAWLMVYIQYFILGSFLSFRKVRQLHIRAFLKNGCNEAKR